MHLLDMEWIYQNSPGIIRTIMLNTYAFNIHRERYGKKFKNKLNELNTTQYYSISDVDDYQNMMLKTIVHHAYETVPYYKQLFDSISLKPNDIKSKDDLYKIPVLTREDVKNNYKRLISTTYYNKKTYHGHTSGTTGAPLDFQWSKDTCIITNAVDWRQKQWAGLKVGDKIALLLGRKVVPPARKKPPFWVNDYLHNQLWLSTFHMNRDNLDFYVRKLLKYKPAAIEGYPSTIYILAKYLNTNNIKLPVKAVLTSSETLHLIQREAIEKAFSCKIFDYYGMAERVVFATECREHKGHHLNFEYAINEIVDKDNNLLGQDQRGYLVGTSLHNFAMPFIRYKSSDITSIKSDLCACGRSMPLIEDVATKAEDIIVTPEGNMISPSSLTHPFKPLVNIEKSQIIQNKLDEIIIKIVPRPSYSEDDTKKLINEFQSRVGNSVKINIEYVDDIERTKSGKFRWVISKVDLPV